MEVQEEDEVVEISCTRATWLSRNERTRGRPPTGTESREMERRVEQRKEKAAGMEVSGSGASSLHQVPQGRKSRRMARDEIKGGK